MKRPFLVAFFLLIAGLSHGYAESSRTGWLPRSGEVFRPLLADPRELHYAVRLVFPVAKQLLGEAAMGDYFGIYRWAKGEDNEFQLSVGGGAFGRFNLAQVANDMQVVDFYANAPFDFRFGDWSARFMMYHTSSHLGDDFVKTSGQRPEKHAWDSLRWLISRDLYSHVRLYGGFNYAFRELPGGYGRSAVQGGGEWTSNFWGNHHAQTYWATDFQSWQRHDWNPALNTQLGIKVIRDPESGRSISFFTEYAAGGRPQGQFFRQRESHWTLGIKFDLS